MRTRVFVVLAVLLAVPCFAKITVREFTMPAVGAKVNEPFVQGDWAVAILTTDLSKPNSALGIIAYDLKAKKVYTLHKGKACSPCIAGSVAMWDGKVDDVPSLAGTIGARGQYEHSLIQYDFLMGQHSVSSLRHLCFAHASSGAYVVGSPSGRLYLANLTTNKETLIVDKEGGAQYPDVAGDLVVWLDQNMEDRIGIVRGYRISTGEKILFTDNLKHSLNCWPRTDGKYVVWLENDHDTYVYDTQTGKVKVLMSSIWPDISDGIVVYAKTPASTGKKERIIYGMDLKTGEEFQISQEVQDTGSRFRIEGNRVVWVEGNVLHCADLVR